MRGLGPIRSHRTGSRLLAHTASLLGVLVGARVIADWCSGSHHGFVPTPSSPTSRRQALFLASSVASSGILLEAPVRAAPPVITFEISVERSPDTSLGVSLDNKDEQKGLLIQSIDGGIIQKWNDENPTKAVQKGDRIVEANKKIDRTQILREVRTGKETLNLVIQRQESKPPDALQITGREGLHSNINGRWSIEFKKLNGKRVYKKDGVQGLYLMFNDCGEFQLDTKVQGGCDGFAVKTKDGWKIDGELDPNVKLQEFVPEKEAIMFT